MPDYYLTLRPATIGTYPKELLDGTALAPEIIADHWPPKRTPDGWNHYATVRYPTTLPFERIWRYDLRPADAVEAAHYRFWLEANRDDTYAAEMEAEWLAVDQAQLADLAQHDNRAHAALRILAARQEASDGT